jgi:small nuclear ribonucleoprotein (snRNP)-like protein
MFINFIKYQIKQTFIYVVTICKLRNMNSRPLDVLDKAKGKRVIVKLKNGVEITGVLQAFDLHLNIWLEDSTERKNESEIKLGSSLVRGDTIILISPAE